MNKAEKQHKREQLGLRTNTTVNQTKKADCQKSCILFELIPTNTKGGKRKRKNITPKVHISI
jgi:hypothetical protein